MPNSMTAGFDDGDAPASDSAEMMAMADKISKAVAADQLKAAADSMNAESNVGGLGDAGASPGFDMQMNERHMIELLELSCEQSEYNCTEANYFAGNTTRNTLVDHCTGKSVNFL